MEDTDFAMRFGRLEAKIDLLLEFREQHAATHEKLEARLTKLESWRWFLLGGAAVVSGAFEVAKFIFMRG